MGKMLIVSFNEDETTILQKIISILHEEKNIEKFELKESSFQSDSDLEIRLNEHEVLLNGKSLNLNHYEFLTFCYLAKHPGWVFSKEKIYEDVWGEAGEHGGTAVVNVISQIRNKLKSVGADKEYIRTVVHRGYKFVP